MGYDIVIVGGFIIGAMKEERNGGERGRIDLCPLKVCHIPVPESPSN